MTTHLRVTVAALLAGIGGFAVLTLLGGSDFSGFAWSNQITSLITIAAGGTLMGVLYLGALKLLHVRELDGMVRMVRTRLGR